MTENNADKAFDFATHFRQAHRALWLVAAAIVWNPSDADDVMQEAAIIAVGKIDSFQPGTNFKAWMAQIVRNVALNHRRHVQRQDRRWGGRVDVHAIETAARPQKAASPVWPDGTLNPMQDAIDDRLMSALRALDPIVRSCVLLRCVEELGYPEISRLLGIPAGTAMSHVFRGRALMAATLSKGEAVRE